jgi:hypothetical protein
MILYDESLISWATVQYPWEWSHWIEMHQASNNTLIYKLLFWQLLNIVLQKIEEPESPTEYSERLWQSLILEMNTDFSLQYHAQNISGIVVAPFW